MTSVETLNNTTLPLFVFIGAQGKKTLQWRDLLFTKRIRLLSWQNYVEKMTYENAHVSNFIRPLKNIIKWKRDSSFNFYFLHNVGWVYSKFMYMMTSKHDGIFTILLQAQKRNIYCKKKYVIDNYNNNDHKTKSLSLSFYICQN